MVTNDSKLPNLARNVKTNLIVSENGRGSGPAAVYMKDTKTLDLAKII